MSEFFEIPVVQIIPPNDPNYRKPQVGNVCVVITKQMIRWQDCIPSCWEHISRPTEWTIIHTPLGNQIINMSYDKVKIYLEEAHSLAPGNDCHEAAFEANLKIREVLEKILAKL